MPPPNSVLLSRLLFHIHKNKHKLPDRLLYPLRFLQNGQQERLSGIRQPGQASDCLPLSSAEIKNEWNHACPPPYALMVHTGTTLPLRILK
jgi:hypothetical protein